MSERIRARYWIETARPPGEAAASMAGEQSSGTFVRVPGQTPELEARAAARVVSIEPLGEVSAPSLPGATRPSPGRGGRWQQAEVVLEWPLANLGPSLPNLMATIAGNLFELAAFSGLRLLDFELPDAFFHRYPGPAFGVDGTRRLTGVHARPIIGTIVKPSVGFDARATADLVSVLCDAGIDFIKDDELQGDGPLCPFADRVDAVMRVIERRARGARKPVMFAFNVTGEIDEMLARHDHVLARGGSCVMVSLNSIGLTGLSALRRHARLPIHAHRNGWGYLSRNPALGFSYVAWQKFWRIAGADHMHVNGLGNKFCESDASVLDSARACLTPMSAVAPCVSMPVFSSGQWPGQAEPTWQGLGSADLIHAAGGGIMAHPGGIAAGVAAMREAWDAAIAGIPVEVYAREHPSLAQALATFGKRAA